MRCSVAALIIFSALGGMTENNPKSVHEQEFDMQIEAHAKSAGIELLGSFKDAVSGSRRLAFSGGEKSGGRGVEHRVVSFFHCLGHIFEWSCRSMLGYRKVSIKSRH